jgi:hypothetical protein
MYQYPFIKQSGTKRGHNSSSQLNQSKGRILTISEIKIMITYYDLSSPDELYIQVIIILENRKMK